VVVYRVPTTLYRIQLEVIPITLINLEEHYEKIAEMAKDGKRGIAGQAPTSFSALTQSRELKADSVKPDQLREFSPTNENLKNIDSGQSIT
jgi:hypothetical protein